ncbi:MAG: Gmad2 immunoglobulin-like domain-containing protein [Candidatus Paceibacterota bacterium]|jgi:hypothetical protein
MRVHQSSVLKIILWSLAGVVVVGVWAIAFWMPTALRLVERRQSLVISGVVADIARDGSSVSVGGFYHAPDARSFSVASDATIVDAQQKKLIMADIRAGFPVHVEGYVLGNMAVAQSITVLDEPPIMVYAPASHDVVSGSVSISGLARVFENQFLIQLTDAAGKVLAQESAYAHAPDAGQYGDFSLTMAIPVSASGTLLLKAFDASPKDGSSLGLVEVPLTIVRGDTPSMNIKVFWGKTGESDINCDRVFSAVRTVGATSSIARAGLVALLTGPTDAEKADGYFSSIPVGVQIQALRIENGIAYVDFNETLDRAVGGSCRVAAIRAQITQTLLQFASVHAVVISINGRIEDILQP